MSIRLASGGHSFAAELPAGCADARRVNCIVLTHKTVLVPAEVFDRASAANYLTLAGLAPDAAQKVVYSDAQQQQIAVMAVDARCHDRLSEALGKRLVYTSPLLHQPHFSGGGLWLAHTDGLLYLKLYDKALRLAEVVRAQGTPDILYYLGRLGRTVPLRRLPLRLSGSSTLARQLRRYFREVQCE